MKVLLIQRGRDPYKGQWAFPGGFLNMDETAEVGALRELKEETGLELDHVRQFHTFTRLDRDPRGRTISIAYYELIDCQKVVGGDDAACARWFSLDDLPPLAFDHADMLKKARRALACQQKLEKLGLV